MSFTAVVLPHFSCFTHCQMSSIICAGYFVCNSCKKSGSWAAFKENTLQILELTKQKKRLFIFCLIGYWLFCLYSPILAKTSYSPTLSYTRRDRSQISNARSNIRGVCIMRCVYLWCCVYIIGLSYSLYFTALSCERTTTSLTNAMQPITLLPLLSMDKL